MVLLLEWLLPLLGAPTKLQLVMVAGRYFNVNPDPYIVVHAGRELPFAPKIDIVFRLFTRANPDHGQVLKWNNPASVRDSNFNASHPTRFTIHGWIADGTSELHTNIRKSYFTAGEFNVINVDWGAGAKTINYITARYRVSSVGDIISRMINTLVAATGISRNSINLIGHSLGAHVAGVAGRLQNGQLNTVVGLDPAGPLFSLSDFDILQPSDAQYVEAVFSSAGSLGSDLPLGDSNFYANGGRHQPGCSKDTMGTCAHGRAHELFAESIWSPVGFWATRCASYREILAGQCTPSGPDARMGGEPSNQGQRVNGIYWFNTSSNAPFAIVSG